MKSNKFAVVSDEPKLPYIFQKILRERQCPIDFYSNVWHLSSDRYAGHLNLRVLNWNIELAPGVLLTDPQQAGLLRGAKEALLVDMACRNMGGSDLSTRVTLRRIAWVVSWMYEQRIESFDQMRSIEIHSLLMDLSQNLAASHGARKQLQPIVTLLERLRGRNDITYPLPRDVKIRRIDSYAEKGSPNSKHDLFPDDDSLIRLLSKAATLVEPWVDELLSLREEYIAHLKPSMSSPKVTDLWGNLVLHRPTLCKRVSELYHLDLTSRRSGSQLLVQLYNACFVLIAGLTGMRVSEILGLEVGCINYVKHSDGVTYGYLQGLRTKKQGGKVLGMWLAPPLCIRAVQILERLRAPLNCYVTKKLAVAYAVKGIWPLDLEKSEIHSINERVMVDRINNLARFGGEEVNWHFTMHQLRRAFCRYVVLRDKRSLLALSEQYGHVHWATTDTGYVGGEFEIDKLLEEEEAKELASTLSQALDAANPSGPGGANLVSTLEEHPFLGQTSTLEAASSMLAAGVIMVPCDWGYCVYRADVSACKGSDLAPNPLGRGPDICAGCKNFGVDERYSQWWKERELNTRSFLTQKNIPWQSRLIAKKRIDIAVKVNKMIGKNIHG